MTAGQPHDQPKSGNQYADQYKEFQTELWRLECKRLGKEKDAVDLAKEEAEEDLFRAPGQSQANTPTAKEQDGDKTAPFAGSPEEQQDDGVTNPSSLGQQGGSPGEQQGGGAREGGTLQPAPGPEVERAGGADKGAPGPEPEPGTPQHVQWMAKQAAANLASDAARNPGGGSPGDGSPGDGTRPNKAKNYPDQPDHFMHPCTLAYCFFGRPAGKNEDFDLKCKPTSGPPGRGRNKKKVKKEQGGSSTDGESGGSESGSSDKAESPPGNPLNAAAIKQFVGAGESQSRAQVKKEAEKLAQRESRDTRAKESYQLFKEQAEVSKKVAMSVERVAEDVHAQRKLDEEEACRKRKHQAIADLKGELEFSDPDRADEIKKTIRDLYKKPVAEFTAPSSAGNAESSSGSGATSVPTTSSGTSGNSNGTQLAVRV